MNIAAKIKIFYERQQDKSTEHRQQIEKCKTQSKINILIKHIDILMHMYIYIMTTAGILLRQNK